MHPNFLFFPLSFYLIDFQDFFTKGYMVKKKFDLKILLLIVKLFKFKNNYRMRFKFSIYSESHQFNPKHKISVKHITI